MNTSPRRRGVRAAVLTIAVGLATLFAAVPAAAAPSSDAGQRDSGFAFVRGAHFSPDTPGVDVYLTAYSGGQNALWLTDVGYGDVSPYRQLKPGPYVVSMRPHGAAASTPAALSWTLNAKAGHAYTAAAVGHNSDLHGIVLRDQLSEPQPGTGDLRVIQAADRLPKAKLVAGSQTVAANVAFAKTTGYSTVPAGDVTVRAASPSSHGPSASQQLAVAPSGVYTVVVLDSKTNGVQLRVLQDASGAGLAPQGAMDTGGGGMATHIIDRPAGISSGLISWSVLAGLAIAALLAVSLATAARRRSV